MKVTNQNDNNNYHKVDK